MSISLSSQLFRFVLQICSIAVLSRLLSPGQVGLVAMVTSILNIAEVVRDFGLSSAAVQAPSLSTAQRSNLFWLNLGIGTACSLLAVASAPLIAHAYGRPELLPIVLALAGVFVVSGANTQYRADLSRQLRFGALAVTDVASLFIGSSLAVASALLGAGYWAIVVQQASIAVSGLVINLVQCRWLPRRYQREADMKPFVRFGAHLLGTNLLGFAVNNVDNLAVGAVWGPTQLGLYSRAYQLMQQPLQQINAPLSRVALPLLSRLSDDAAYLRLFRRLQLVVCFTLGLGFATMAGLSVPTTDLLLGSQWYAVAPIMAILAVSGVFRGLDAMSYQIWVSRGLTGPLFRFYLWSRPVMIGLILAGLPWGPVGVATGHLVAAVAHWLVGTRLACRSARLPAGAVLMSSFTVVVLVLAPAAVLARLATLLDVGSVLQILVGGAAAAAWAVMITALVPSFRKELLTVVAAMRDRRRGRVPSPV